MTRLRSERGSALIAGMMAIMLMMMLGIAAMSFVDGQSSNTRQSRVQESAFHTSEAALSAEAFTLARDWPAASTGQMPVCTYTNGTITSTTGNVSRCPDATTMNQTLTGPDVAGAGNVSWSVEVRDNGGTDVCPATGEPKCSFFWDETVSRSDVSWDRNADNEMWVRAQAIVRGQRRTVVGRVRITKNTIQLPKAAVTAGKFNVAGGGPKGFVTLNGSMMALRCDISLDACLHLQKPSNIVYPGTVDGYPSFDDGGRTLTTQQIAQLRETARANGTWYAAGSCPPSTPAGYSGSVVFIENANCSLTGNGTINSQAAPGMILVNRGTLKFTGTKTIYGTIYMANAQNSTANDVLDLGGNSTIVGSVFIDGSAGLSVTGSTKVVYDANSQANIATIVGAGLVRSSFRELDV